MSLANKIAQSKDTWERKPFDFYNTPPAMTQALLNVLKLPKGLRVREPCCGEGHLSHVLARNGLEVTSSDIRHTGYGEGGVDYLTLPEVDPVSYDFEAVITNPPFSHAEGFIRRALRDAPIVAMLLPSGYWHARGRARLFETRPPQAILSPTWRPAFLEAERGSSPLMNVIWTVWIDSPDDTMPGTTIFKLIHKPLRYPAPPIPTAEVLLGRTNGLDDLAAALERRNHV